MIMQIMILTTITFAVWVFACEVMAQHEPGKFTVRDRIVYYPLTFALLLAAMWIGART